LSINSLKNDLEGIATRVSEFILSCLRGQPSELYQASSFYLNSGGKRLRPFMVIKSCEMFGGSEIDAIPSAAAVEMIHNFSLIHDDIMDNDDLRHGSPTVHKHYGVPLALLAGDVLFSKAFEILCLSVNKSGVTSKTVREMVEKLATACVSVCEGQATDTALALGEQIPSINEYLDMVTKKTASLFEVSCALGVLSCPGTSTEDVIQLSNFGKGVGIAFQLIDDLIGIVGDPKLTGKAVGNDIREGKKTYPIILAIKYATDNDKNKIMRVYGRRKSSEEDVRLAVNTISSFGIDSEVRSIARSYMDKSLNYISRYSNTDAKRALETSAKFIVERSL
jgi:geranylgeranyl diphosphate synthase type I